ncbi:MAG: acyl-CoA thioesterase [Acetobacteraceae bacterium]|nr:acyl-CoA thioesterase [Acetobacteraceae bacterium]
MSKPHRASPGQRADYRAFFPMTTRWADNDPYGHVNNVVYHAWFDTAVNRFLIANGLLHVTESAVIAVMAENGCRYHSELAYPDEVTVGVRVGRVGASSVRYESGAFRADAQAASAEGFLVHVYVNRATMRPVPMPADVRAALATIAV